MEANRKAPAPFLLPVLFWTVGIILSKCLQPEINFQLIIAGGLIIAAIFMRKIRQILLLILFLFLGMLRLSLFQQDSSAGNITAGKGTPSARNHF